VDETIQVERVYNIGQLSEEITWMHW